jgi:hypothetical protein
MMLKMTAGFAPKFLRLMAVVGILGLALTSLSACASLKVLLGIPVTAEELAEWTAEQRRVYALLGIPLPMGYETRRAFEEISGPGDSGGQAR